MTINTILFDAGDVLYSKPRRDAEVARFLVERGLPAPARKDPVERGMRLAAHAGKIGVPEFFGWLLAHYGVTDPDQMTEGLRLLREQQGDVQFFDGVADTLHALKQRGFQLGIVTNTFNSRDEKTRWFRSVGIHDIWDSYADSRELQIVKPEPEIYLAALTPLGVSPDNAAFVGHAQYELDGAKALGMTTILFNPDVDATRADFSVERFADLLALPVLRQPAQAASPSRGGRQTGQYGVARVSER
ncbi:HAD family hydrolase [Nitratireductor pacificus]|uniref:phosphoglycolate phosphatase n=1 Tax=Nitratireductor pacificus pht-3B TaxID=391937 RepID=K2MT67_9HYPH|nr:HAD-IA family hydrolase [Nitratireductor pacificus]EKF20547.1 HAD superfamily hydrolase [Nitratireductor pacificus pht-3B]